MVKRPAKPVTLDALARNPALLRTLKKGERTRLARRFRRLFDIWVMVEFERLENTRRLVEEWTHNQAAGADRPPRRRLRALPGGKAKR